MTIYSIIFFVSFLIFPLSLYVIFKMKFRKVFRIITIFILILFIFGHFIEPKMIILREIKIQTGFTSKFAVIGDIDLGYYKDNAALSQVVKDINDINADFLLFAGNIVGSEKMNDPNLQMVLSAFRNINTPSFFISSDDRPTSNILKANGFTNLLKVTPKVEGIYIVGMNEGQEGYKDLEMLNLFHPEDNVLVISHNPELLLDFPKDIADLSFSSSTGKKIRIPFTNKYIFPSHSSFEKGLYGSDNGRIYVTSGLGESTFPFRLFNPPEIIKVETF